MDANNATLPTTVRLRLRWLEVADVVHEMI